MSWLIEAALRLRILVVAAAITLLVVGVREADQVPLDVFPEFAPPVVEIQTEVPGVSTEEVESLVTVPIENAPPARTCSPRANWCKNGLRLLRPRCRRSPALPTFCRRYRP